MLFTSDNWAGVHPTILKAIFDANSGSAPAYGNDCCTEDTVSTFRTMFGDQATIFFVATGSAANSLALSTMVPPWGTVLCHEQAHIHLDECAAPEFFTGGAKIWPLKGEHGKLTPAVISDAMGYFTPPMTHHVVPGAVSLTQATEAGTIYSVEELKALCDTARQHGLHVHMDGARFGNACASTGVAPFDYVAAAGVDILTLGGTKNGCMVAEAIVCLNPELSETLAYRQKRAGQSFSKGRFLAAQWDAYFKDDLWLSLASQANRQARTLADGLIARNIEVLHETEINEVFVLMDDTLVSDLKSRGASFYDWVQPGDPFGGKLRRLVTSFTTSDEEVSAFLSALDDVRN